MMVIKNSGARRALKIIIPFVFIPAFVTAGALIYDEKRYLLVSLGVAVMSLLLFITGFEKKITGSRRMVIVSVMTALCIVGRFIPFFKPVTVLTVITGIYLGGEAGFLVGAMSALLSNFYFGQGPWTPFQMLAWGLIGLFAGFISDKLKKSKLLLLFYGVLSGVFFSLVMDIWTVLWYDGSFNVSLYIAAFMTALPHTVLYSISKFIFLWFAAKPFGAKLERIKIKYGV